MIRPVQLIYLGGGGKRLSAAGCRLLAEMKRRRRERKIVKAIRSVQEGTFREK